ncbi:hypothetical protein H6P81_019106 [Aristolochia fimbriata]|uniref:FAD-binding PCMH-type domain-containing protein n=1 Tax=Aristolochia fimbriata TaxID=158543 RepID=A0AAV7DTU1_ARIFI|nr:hypothetical protein H6P81_019106 [Aristolochia fimbriata]
MASPAIPTVTILSLLPLLILLLSSSFSSMASPASTTTTKEYPTFLHCFSGKLPPSTDLSQLVFSRNSSSYTTILHFSAQNPYLLSPSSLTTKPLYVITPRNEPQIQASLLCAKRHGLQVRVRSGGHDYEGLSYVAREPFLLLDLINYRAIYRVNVDERTAWVQAGATIGELLVPVPPSVTVFTVSRTLEEGAEKLFNVWQKVSALQLPEELTIRVILQAVVTGRRTVQATFNSLYYGTVPDLLRIMNRDFPELGLKAEDCEEMSWVESTMYFAGINITSGTPKEEALLNRSQPATNSFKNKSDFVKKPISEKGLRGIWNKLLEEERGMMILEPLGGKVDAVSESGTPFPHRKGNLYNIQYVVTWLEGADANKYIDWMRSLHKFMTPYVSQSPRGAYLNYRDLDLGMNEGPDTSYQAASVWGLKYFKGNFRRLALVKGRVDKENFFRSEQSIPPLLA